MPYFCRYIILAVFTLPFVLIGQNGWENFHHLTIDDGLPNNYVYDLLQDEKGFMWFATESGLSRFDGYFFHNYTVMDGIAKNDIRRIISDRQNDLWVLTQNELSHYDKANNKFSTLDIGRFTGDKRILTLLEDHQGNVWFSSSQMLFFKKAGTSNDSITDIDLSSLNIVGSPLLKLVDSKGHIWIYENNGFSILKDKTLYQRIALTFPVTSNTYGPTICLLKSGEVVYASDKGLVSIGKEGSQTLISDIQTPLVSPTDMMQDRSGDLWVASRDNGV